MEYIRRVVDNEIDRKTQAFNAVNIVGPKGCGKTRTAKERCKTIIEFQDEERRRGYLAVADTSPVLLLNSDKPILFDEWQDAPGIWGTIRKACDDNPDSVGEYFLTGSTSMKVNTPHTGTGRISEITMHPMTLWETGESNGKISVYEAVDNAEYTVDGCVSDVALEDLFFAICRGGWPRCLSLKNQKAQLEIAKDYYSQIYSKDVSAVDGVKRNPEWTRTIMWSYARNMATLAQRKNIYADVRATQDISEVTFDSYVDVLKQLYVINDIDAWTPQVRSKTSIRASKKHIFIDPSIGLATLGIAPDYFNKDLDLFGHAFENMMLRDLQVYAQAHDARILHYRDNFGLEADAVYQLNDGRYALIEIKTGANAIADAEKNLLKFKELINKHNDKALADAKHPGTIYREPSALMIICATLPMAYTTPSGVKVIPAGCLKD